jgi:Xaa-Pro aminopeptidase
MTPDLPFTVDEYQARINQVRAAMEKRGLDVLLFVNPVSTYYLTGYQTFSVRTYQCLILPRQGLPTMLAWELELPSALASSWVEDGAAYHTGEDKFQITRRVLAQHGLLGGTIGIERDSPYLSALEQDRLATALDGCALADGSGIVKQLLRVKSPRRLPTSEQPAARPQRACAPRLKRPRRAPPTIRWRQPPIKP